jgi:urease accessory protein
MSAPALLRLLAWLSPSFPVGAFSYSHGLEWAIEDGTVRDAATLAAWIGDVLRHGAGRSDAILLAAAWRAARDGDGARLAEIAELAAALQPSKERHLEATAQGEAFLATVRAAWPRPVLAALPPAAPATYPVAVAIAAAGHAVPLAAVLAAYLAGFVANLVSAGVRAVPIGQTDGQRIIAALAAPVAALAEAALREGLDGLGGAALRADIASMRHETQYTRLFRS